MLDYLGQLVFESVLGRHVLLHVDAQQVETVSPSPQQLLGLVLGLRKIPRVGPELRPCTDVFQERLSDRFHNVIFIYYRLKASPHGYFQRDRSLRNGVGILLAENYLEDAFERVFVAGVEAEPFGDGFLNERDQAVELHPGKLLVGQHQRPLQAVAKASAALAE